MFGDRSEEEQIEQIRRWWQEYRRSVIAGVIIALIAVIGWQQWQSYQERQAVAAFAAYRALLADLRNGHTAAAQHQAEQLRSEHAGSPYAVLGSFRMANQYVAKGNLQAAAKALRWVVEHATAAVFQSIARLRLARVLLGSGETQAALKVAQPVPEGAFASQFQELIGDIHVAQSNRAAAIKAYRAALVNEVTGQRRGLIEAKLNNLGWSAESTL